jgi:hypothetical protein
VTVRKGIETAEKKIAILRTRRRTIVVALGAQSAGAAVPPLLARRMMFLGLHFQPERVKILA